jgi:hypothetical protein
VPVQNPVIRQFRGSVLANTTYEMLEKSHRRLAIMGRGNV